MKAKLIHEVHDLWPETLVTIGGMSRKHPFVKLLQMAENSAYKKSDYVVGFNEVVKKHFIEHGMKEEKFRCVPLGVIVDEWNSNEKNILSSNIKERLEEIKNESKFIVGYFGGHALSNALDTLIETAKKIEDKEVYFVLVGNGAEKEGLMQKAKDYALSNISFFNSVNRKEIPRLLAYFDCVYVGIKPSSLYKKSGITLNKLYDSMMACKPIVANIGDISSPLDGCKCALVSKPGDIKQIIKDIETIKNLSVDKRIEMGKLGRKIILNKYNYEINAKKFEDIFYENSDN